MTTNEHEPDADAETGTGEPDSRGKVWEDSDTLVKSVSRHFNLHYANGTRGKLTLVFSAYMKAYMKQEGSASKLPFHPIDTRDCTYSVNSRIERTGFLTLPNGSTTPLSSVTKVLQGAGSSGGKDYDWTGHWAGEHSPCADHVNAFRKAKQRISASIEDDLEAFVLDSLEPAAIPEMATLLKAKVSKAS